MTKSNDAADQLLLIGGGKWVKTLAIEFSATNLRNNRQLMSNGMNDDTAQIRLVEINEREAVLELPDSFSSFGESLIFRVNTKNLNRNISVELKAKIIKHNVDSQSSRACTVHIQFEKSESVQDLIAILDLFRKSQTLVEQLFSRMKD